MKREKIGVFELQSPSNSPGTKVKLNFGIVAIITLFSVVVLPFLFRRQQPPVRQLDLTPLNKAIADIANEIHDTKVVLEKIEEAQRQHVTPAKKISFRQQLFSSEYYKPTDVIQIIISIVGFGAIIVSLFFTEQGLILTNKQIQANTTSLDLTINQNIMSHALDVDKLFIDSPDLRPYFFEGTAVPSSNKNFNKAKAIADYQIDFFATFFDQTGNWQVFQRDLEAQNAWDSYMDNSFQQSPIMCYELKEASIGHSYTDWFINRFKGDCPKEFGT